MYEFSAATTAGESEYASWQLALIPSAEPNNKGGA
jgi:hypothetical protein